MARRRREEEHENHERWLVSYADFITLLFAFFVVMYSISSVNEGKYKILSESLVGVFSSQDRAIKPIPVGEERPRTTEPIRLDIDQGATNDQAEAPEDPLKSIARSMREAFGDLIGDGQLTVRGNELWIELELSSSLLFPSGDAIPNDRAFELIEKVAAILAPYQNPIHVEGFTDNLPISTASYPTNWELSAARAASVVRMLAAQGVDADRLAAVGYGEFQPVADNATAEGRARNRRVVLVVSRNLDVRRSVTSAGSANTEADATLQRAGTQTAPRADR
ncbi:flagellar motor protein MotD [Stutzerimonas azotifigens]|uniref:Flagellar motor protein MotD n=1 Tax=Stutzerimonas azotifigens TaxID=291995 RepID=A0ABR5YY20_9GAMM|nr:flagellar motor protein MotD [Stutzerimonas azotifigens]MBA1272819.1 flagellar motor protein MotD [Stutzerimonas azotifigens]